MDLIYYDRLSDMVTLESDSEAGIEFLGPITQAILKLKEYGYDPSVAREAVVKAFFTRGEPVDLETVERMSGNGGPYFYKTDNGE